jgi:hypothetical protein
MPPLPDVPNVLRCKLMFHDGGDNDVQSNFFFRYSGSLPDASTALGLATSLATAAGPFAGLMDESTSLVAVRVTDLSSMTGGDATATATVTGNRSNAILPGGTALLVNYSINRRYRGGKPRVYLPFGVQTDLQTRQQWSAAFVATAQSGHDDFTSAATGTTSGSCTITAHVNVSYYQGFTVVSPGGGKRAKNVSTPRAVPVVDDIVHGTVSTVPASQRRRNR